MGRYLSTQLPVSTFRCTFDVIGACCCAWTVPTGITTATFELWGGGGAGGPHCCCYCGMSTSGAGGGYALKTIAVTAGSTYTICAGGCGVSVYCSVGGANTGCPGSTTYVTGTGLSNLCAVGGSGGAGGSCCCSSACTCCGGAAYGGDVCLYGGFAYNSNKSPTWCAMSFGGPAPFGGGVSYFQAQNCCQYFSCGNNGMFPGGGGTGGSNCCCDCCYCQGAGAPGLVRITF